MNLYCIFKESEELACSLLKKECLARKINFIPIVVEKFNFLEAPKLVSGDFLYRITANNPIAKKIEHQLLNDRVATFYSSNDFALGGRPSSHIMLEKVGISIPKTVPLVTNDRRILSEYVNFLGGFPVVIKALGHQGGVGVMKIDSLQSLFSISDYLLLISGNYIMRQYIDTQESLRAVVVGDKVVASVKYKATREDFRSNRKVTQKSIETVILPKNIQENAIKATHSLGLEFGGVDILIDKDGSFYILEINFPFAFPGIQDCTGINIAEAMLNHLTNKSKKL